MDYIFAPVPIQTFAPQPPHLIFDSASIVSASRPAAANAGGADDEACTAFRRTVSPPTLLVATLFEAEEELPDNSPPASCPSPRASHEGGHHQWDTGGALPTSVFILPDAFILAAISSRPSEYLQGHIPDPHSDTVHRRSRELVS